MDISSIAVQQMASNVESLVSMVKQSSESDKAAVGLLQQALDMAKEENAKVTATRGNNLNMIL